MNRPLFTRFPELAGRIPILEFAKTPTPVIAMPELGAEIGCEKLYVKRDDKSSPEYGGNKCRKLEFILARAKLEGAAAVITIGGIGTNHGLATAVFARKIGLGCHLVLFDQPVTKHVRENLLLFHRYGAVCHYAGGYIKTALIAARELAASRVRAGGKTFLVHPGGSSPLGTLGFVNAALELEEQIAAGVMPEPEYIFCPIGSCGTYAGIALGIKLTKLRTRAIGVRVVDRTVVNKRAVLRLAERARSLMVGHGADVGGVRLAERDITVMQGFFGGRYGRVTSEGRQAVELAARHGLKLETTYTGKTFAGMTDFLGRKSGCGPILYWNTFNSVDLSAEASNVSVADIAPPLRRFFETEIEE